MHRESTDTTSRKTPGWDSALGPSCCNATVIPNVKVYIKKTYFSFLGGMQAVLIKQENSLDYLKK